MKRLWRRRRCAGLIALGLLAGLLAPVAVSPEPAGEGFGNSLAAPACGDGGVIWTDSYGTCDDVDCCGGPARDKCQPISA